MKNIRIILIFVGSFSTLFAQTKWADKSPFERKEFIENKGQFEIEGKLKSEEILFQARIDGVQYYFTKTGYLIGKKERVERTQEEIEKLESQFKNKEYGREEEEGKFKYKQIEKFHELKWLDANLDVEVVAEKKVFNYYTFANPNSSDKNLSIKANAFERITYKNIYPKTDIVFEFPKDSTGIKYIIYLYPGAEVEKIKMTFPDNKNINFNSNGDVEIMSVFGLITNHQPKLFDTEDKKIREVKFVSENNNVSLKMAGSGGVNYVISGWTTTPSSLTTNNDAYDIDFDYQGNVYISGGTPPYKLIKYSSVGTLLWTFTNPSGWGTDYYSKFCVLPESGTSFIGEAFSGAPRVMKINADGSLNITSVGFVGNNEIWTMFYNGCTGQLIGFGGGTDASLYNLQIIADINLTSSTNIKFNTASGSCCNDIASAKMDYNGDFYALLTSAGGTTSTNNQIQKSLLSSNYNPPVAWDISSGYDFNECYNNGFPGHFGCDWTVRANALSVSPKYLYSYDGKILKAWNKSNGGMLGSLEINTLYSAGQNRTHEGISADDCNNEVYVGGNMMVHAYSFDGSNFTAKASINTNITGEVFDLKMDGVTGMLYVCGRGFVSAIQVNNLSDCASNLSVTTDPCVSGSSVTLNISGGNPPYQITWNTNPVQTGATLSNVSPGTYSYVVSDGSCNKSATTGSVTVGGGSGSLESVLPNVFTPNADGLNDIYYPFSPQSVKNSPTLDLYDLRIFNRYGIEIFKSDNPLNGWNGKTDSGAEATEGVYYWILKYTGCSKKEEVSKGFVHLLR